MLCVQSLDMQLRLVQAARQVALGMRSMHAVGLVHMDLKADNCLVSQLDVRFTPTVKVCARQRFVAGWLAVLRKRHTRRAHVLRMWTAV
jgi:serine/threonine protein kinase